MHSSNSNNHEVGRQAWVVFFLKLRKANEILKLASAFFAQAELDRRLKI